MEAGKFKLQISKDGSHTIFSEQFQASYHSIHGAIQESNHVFINHGLGYISKEKSDISIFEVGFGTGLNAALSYQFANDHNLILQYSSIEAYPINIELVEKFNYGQIDKSLTNLIFKDLHLADWNTPIEISNNFRLHKILAYLEDGVEGSFDIVYFDAFASSTQSELWTPGIFLNMYRILNPSGILVTYAATGRLKRLLRSCGFTVESLQGPPGKREMTRAIKTHISPN